MQVLSFNSTKNEMKQVVVLINTMHVISTDKGKTKIKKFPAAYSKDWRLLYEKEYSIQYPKGWTVDKPCEMGVKFVLLSKPNGQPDRFRENINLTVQDLKGQKINLDKFVEISENQVRTMITNGKVLEGERSSIAGYELHKIVYTGNNETHKLKFVQYYYIRNEKAYILTLTCEADEFDKYKKTAARIMNSFRFHAL